VAKTHLAFGCGAPLVLLYPTGGRSGLSHRALNSAVECHLHTVEVVGSNPTAPTNRINKLGSAPAGRCAQRTCGMSSSIENTSSGSSSYGKTWIIQVNMVGMNVPPSASQAALVWIDPNIPNFG
jgi:hypothetical protein